MIVYRSNWSVATRRKGNLRADFPGDEIPRLPSRHRYAMKRQCCNAFAAERRLMVGRPFKAGDVWPIVAYVA
jgi:hypothetical protein